MVFDNALLAQLNANRLYRTIGLTITHAHDRVAISDLRACAEVAWPQADQPHGGIVFTQIDTTMATAVMTSIGDEQRCSTIDASVHYVGPATGEILRCEARCTHRTGRMAFVRAETHDPSGRLVAQAQGTFRIFSQSFGISIV